MRATRVTRATWVTRVTTERQSIASFLSSSRFDSIRPAPRTTEVSGSSAICTGSSRVVAQPLVEIPEQRSAAGDDDAAIVDVGGELRRNPFERAADGLHDHVDGALQRFANLAIAHQTLLGRPSRR